MGLKALAITTAGVERAKEPPFSSVNQSQWGFSTDSLSI